MTIASMIDVLLYDNPIMRFFESQHEFLERYSPSEYYPYAVPARTPAVTARMVLLLVGWIIYSAWMLAVQIIVLVIVLPLVAVWNWLHREKGKQVPPWERPYRRN